MSAKSGFLVVEQDGTQHLPTRKDGKLDTGLLGAAHAALVGGGFRGNKYEGPNKQKAISKLKKLYEKAGLDWPDSPNASMKKTTDIVWAHGADTYTMNDLQTQLCNLARADDRFNRDSTGVKATNCYVWAANIVRDEDNDDWSVVICACDGNCYEIGFDIAEDGTISLDSGTATKVTTKTTYIPAKQYCWNGQVVKSAKASPVDKSEEAHQATQDANDASDKANESHNVKNHEAAADAHEEAADAHRNAAEAHEDDSANAQHHEDMAEKHDAKSEYHSDCAANLKGSNHRRDGVRAAGTQDGANKGSATRKSAKADEASQDAHEASMKAHESGDGADHEAAQDAHENAADAHKAAMLAHAKAGNDDEAEGHAKMMAAHDEMACAHGSCDSDKVEAAMKTIGLTIQARAAEKQVFLRCRASGVKLAPAKDWVMDEEVTFCYMPGGVSTIQAGFRDNDAINITVEVDEDTAKTVQASYDNLRSSAPKQKPYVDLEHDPKSGAALHPASFSWGSYDETDGVLIAATPTALGVREVNGKIRRSFSPTFATDADYAKAKLRGGVYTFPEGIRGSASNPARITGVDFCVGTLTNQPAFRNMPPVKAKTTRTGTTSKILTTAEVLNQLKAAQLRKLEILTELNDRKFPVPIKTKLTSTEVLAQLRRKRPPAS